jgi:hypothetical protein
MSEKNIESQASPFLKIDLKSDIKRLFQASERLKELKLKLSPELQEEVEQIIHDLSMPDDKAFLKIDFKGDITRIESARKRLEALKGKTEVSLHEQIDEIAKDIR